MAKMPRTNILVFRSIALLFFISISLKGFSLEPGLKKPEFSMLCNISFPQSASANVNTIYIPFTLVGRLMIVQATVNNLTGNFIVDTGSERLLLNKDYIVATTPGKMITAVGSTGLVGAVEHRVDSLRLDRLSIYNLLGHLVDLDHIEIKKNTKITGILGYNVFKDYELFIDFLNSRIVMSRLDKNGLRLDRTAAWEKPYDSLSFELKKHFIVLRPVVNNVQLEMILDSGAELNLIDRRVNRKVLDRFEIIKRVNLIGVGKKQVEVMAGTLKGVKCGNQNTDSMNTLL